MHNSLIPGIINKFIVFNSPKLIGKENKQSHAIKNWRIGLAVLQNDWVNQNDQTCVFPRLSVSDCAGGWTL